jgi:excisionase family DNA binding protein
MPDVVLLTTSEVAKRFRVDTSVVRRWVAKKQLLPSITTPGGHYRFDEADLAAFSQGADDTEASA